jgi:dTDP-4-amino-4,6-dideoxygalactose transaminase
MSELGFNYRLTDLQSALGLSQLRHLEEWLARRRGIARQYADAFAGEPALELPVSLADRESAWHLYVVRLRLERLKVDRAQVFRALRAENIGVNVHYIPVPWHPYYASLGYERGQWPIAEAAYERLLSLPMWAGMTDTDVDDVVAAVRKVLAAYAR